MVPTAIVALCLLALTSAAPQCSTSCNASPKTSYAPGTTYTYEYTVRNTIMLEGVEGGSSTSDYSATVTLSVVSPCDVAVSLQNVAGSNIADIQERQVERYPLMVALNNGQVEKVCSHPEDDISSINIKKAIASAFQNVLPTLEPTSAPQYYTEGDIFGICPTEYNVETEGDKTLVTKNKMHRNCQEPYYNQTRAPFLHSQTRFPIQYSDSRCLQVLTNGIYSNIRCIDTKYIAPGLGFFKYVMALQDLTLQFVSESADTSAASSIEGQELNSQSLSHQQELPPKNPALVPKVDAIMPEICYLSQGQGSKQVTSLVAQAIELLRFVPDDAVVEVLDKIRAGQYCEDYTKLESLFLDAVAFVGEPGAFKVMAQEIAAGRTTGGRFSLYTVSVNLLTQPTLNHIAVLKPIFGMTDSNQLLSLAASTVVNRYCTQNSNCDQSTPVKEILNLLSAKLLTQCTPDFSNEKPTQVLTTLASFGNIGKLLPDMLDVVMKCASTEGIDTTVRFAATMSLKGIPCLRPVTESLKSMVLDASMNTEVRIGSYIAAIRCAEERDLEELINAMSSETNKQVQGFILSHLENLQETNWLLKQNLYEILASKNIPNDYMRNISKYSRNIEMSNNAPIIELGGSVESNIVYTPESYVPRLVSLGLNMNLLGSFINIGEVGARVEGFDPYLDDALGPNSYLYQDVFGPNSYLYKTPLWSIIEDSKLSMTQRGTEILQQVKQLIKNSNNINADSILNAFNKVFKNVKNIDVQSALSSIDFDSIIKSIVKFLNTNKFQLPRTDLYAFLRAQEHAFVSFGGEQNQFTINELVESVIPVIMNVFVMAQDLNVDTARTGQINIDYSIPAISGIPLKLKLTGTGVAGFQLRNNLNIKSDVDALLKIIPSLSAQIEGQIGFGELMNTGIKLRSCAYTTNGFALNVVQKNDEDFELELELPEKMELFDIDTETFFMKLDKASNEVKLFPSNMRDIRIASNECSGIIEQITGLKVCYNMNVSDLLKSNSLPLGQPLAFRVYLEKSDEALKGYRLEGKLKNKPNNKLVMVVAGTYGSADSKSSTLGLSYNKEQDTYHVATHFQSTFIESKCELIFTNQPEDKSLQYYTSSIIGDLIQVDGAVKVESKPVAVSNGNTYEVAAYAGLTKSLDKTDLFHSTFEAEIELPSNAGLRIYKVERITMRSEVFFMEIEALFLKKSSEVYQTSLNITKMGSTIATFDAIHTISIESPLTGFNAMKLNLMTTANAKLPMVEFGMNSKLTYKNGAIEASSGVKYYDYDVAALSAKLSYSNRVIEVSGEATYFDAKVLFANCKQTLDFTSPALEIQIEVPNVFLVVFSHTVDYTGITTMLEVEAPAVIKTLKFTNVFGISNLFKYTLLTDVTNAGSVVLNVDGSLTFDLTRSLFEQYIDLRISGAFDGSFNIIMHGITWHLKKLNYTVDVRHTNMPIVVVDIALERTSAKEVAGKVTVNVPFVIESDLAATISTSLISATLNTLALPNTDYARRFKGYAHFNWAENNFKGELFWDAEKDNDKKLGLTTKYALDTTAFKMLLQGELSVTTLNYGYKLESVLASPFDLFQGNSGLELALSLPSQKVAVAKTMLDIQYADSQVTLKPLIAFITIYENKYELTSTMVVKLLPAFLNFDVTCKTTLSTPQLQQITLTSKWLHAVKDQSGMTAFKMTLKESVLSEACSLEYILEPAPSTLKETLRAQYGTKVVALVSDIVINSGLQDFVITHKLNLPLADVKLLIVKLTKTTDGTLALAFMINEQKIVNLYYNLLMFTNHIVGIEFPSRTLEYSVVFASNQVNFKIFPEKNKSDKAVETTLRIIPNASTVQFEALMAAPFLSKEMRFAVELELIEPGKKGYDMVNIDVQYQVYEASKLLKATLNELQSIYGNLVNDGLIPDLNEWYKIAQKLMKHLPVLLNNIRDQLMVMVPLYSGYVKNYVLNLYQLYEPDLITLWDKIQSDLLMCWNIIKTETPVLLKNYVEVIKKTETWNVVQTTLNEVMVNYPAYYDAAVDFYNKITISVVATQFGKHLLDTQILKKLITTFPTVFNMVEDFYSKVILPIFEDISAVVQKLISLPILDVYQMMDFMKTDVLSFVKNLLKNMSSTDLFNKLMAIFDQLIAAYPDEYNTIIQTFKQMNEITLNDIISAINSYLFDKFGMSFSITAEKLTAVVPLPVTAVSVRNYYQAITVYIPAYIIDALYLPTHVIDDVIVVIINWVLQGHLVYQYIEAQVPVVMDYINTQATIYLHYVKVYVQKLQVVISQFINEIHAKLPQYIKNDLAYFRPYVEEIIAMMETYYKMVQKSTYGMLTEKKFMDLIELLLLEFNEVIQAVNDSVILYIYICLDYTFWVITTILENPTVQKIMSYIFTLIPNNTLYFHKRGHEGTNA